MIYGEIDISKTFQKLWCIVLFDKPASNSLSFKLCSWIRSPISHQVFTLAVDYYNYNFHSISDISIFLQLIVILITVGLYG